MNHLCTIPSQNRDMVDEKSENYIFVSYSKESKGYQFFSLKMNKLVLSRDIVFDELIAWKWKDKIVEHIATSKVFQPSNQNAPRLQLSSNANQSNEASTLRNNPSEERVGFKLST